MERHKLTDKEVAEFRRLHNSNLYFNPKDSNMFVPKENGKGYVTNWANPWSLLIVAVLLAACVYLFVIVK
jgi:uncharacterized membrane protein